MTLRCALCGQTIEFADDLPNGQHIRCPYCTTKMVLDFTAGGMPSLKVISGSAVSQQAVSKFHVRQPSRVEVPMRTHAPMPKASQSSKEGKGGGSNDWVIYTLLAVVIAGGVVFWRQKRLGRTDVASVVTQVENPVAPSSRAEADADLEKMHREEDAEREKRRVREESEREQRRVEKEKRDAEREKVRREMAERANRERRLREIVTQTEMDFDGASSFFAVDFPKGKRPFDFVEGGVFTVVDENYLGNRSLYRLTVDGNRLVGVQKVSQRDGAEDLVVNEFMRMVTNKVVLAKRDSGPVWICGSVKMNELIEVPNSADTYAPLCDFLGGVLPVLNSLRVVPPAIKYRVTLKAKNGKGEIKLGIVESKIDLQSVRSKIRQQLTDRKLKSAGSGIKPPTMKKFKRTVVFYEGDRIFKAMNGITKVPRSFKFFGTSRNHDNKGHVNDIIENARRKWEELRTEAERQDQEELAVEAENQRRMDEYRRKTDAALRDSKVTESEVDAELGLYRLFIERSRTKLPKE